MNLPADASNDQSNAPHGYYRRTNGMLHQLQPNDVETASNAITEAQLSRLDSMSREELVGLVRLCNVDAVAIALMSKAEIAESMLQKLAVNALTSKDAKQTLENVNAWLDRERGKAAAIQVNAQSSGNMTIQIVRFCDGDE